MTDRLRIGTISALLLLQTALGASAQSNTQLWSEVRLDWIKSRDVTYSVTIEPKIIVTAPADDPWWATLDVTPSVEYTHGQWIDVLGELMVGRTKQTDDLNSTELTPRVGVRLHLLSNLEHDLVKEKVSRRRLVVRDLLRLEWRNLYYSTDKPDASTVRLRNRIELLYPITRARITDAGAVYLSSDAEWFWPADDPDERFANKQRLRAGFGYRRSRAWRFEALVLADRSRDAADNGFTAVDYALDIKVRRVW